MLHCPAHNSSHAAARTVTRTQLHAQPRACSRARIRAAGRTAAHAQLHAHQQPHTHQQPRAQHLPRPQLQWHATVPLHAHYGRACTCSSGHSASVPPHPFRSSPLHTPSFSPPPASVPDLYCTLTKPGANMIWQQQLLMATVGVDLAFTDAATQALHHVFTGAAIQEGAEATGVLWCGMRCCAVREAAVTPRTPSVDQQASPNCPHASSGLVDAQDTRGVDGRGQEPSDPGMDRAVAAWEAQRRHLQELHNRRRRELPLGATATESPGTLGASVGPSRAPLGPRLARRQELRRLLVAGTGGRQEWATAEQAESTAGRQEVQGALLADEGRECGAGGQQGVTDAGLPEKVLRRQPSRLAEGQLGLPTKVQGELLEEEHWERGEQGRKPGREQPETLSAMQQGLPVAAGETRDINPFPKARTGASLKGWAGAIGETDQTGQQLRELGAQAQGPVDDQLPRGKGRRRRGGQGKQRSGNQQDQQAEGELGRPLTSQRPGGQLVRRRPLSGEQGVTAAPEGVQQAGGQQGVTAAPQGVQQAGGRQGVTAAPEGVQQAGGQQGVIAAPQGVQQAAGQQGVTAAPQGMQQTAGQQGVTAAPEGVQQAGGQQGLIAAPQGVQQAAGQQGVTAAPQGVQQAAGQQGVTAAPQGVQHAGGQLGARAALQGVRQRQQQRQKRQQQQQQQPPPIPPESPTPGVAENSATPDTAPLAPTCVPCEFCFHTFPPGGAASRHIVACKAADAQRRAQALTSSPNLSEVFGADPVPPRDIGEEVWGAVPSWDWETFFSIHSVSGELLRRVPQRARLGVLDALCCILKRLKASPGDEAATLMFLAFPRLILGVPAKEGLGRRAAIVGRLGKFWAGEWQQLFEAASAALTPAARPLAFSLPERDADAIRLARCRTRCQVGEWSRGLACLTAGDLAQPSQLTVDRLTAKHPASEVPVPEWVEHFRIDAVDFGMRF
ncbi:unnamed protein product [Closterium sp. Naga37s-1]|nr:unnamed protein product [Closterium sp. Naga37s-1]